MNSLKFVKSLRVVKKIKIKDNEYILNTGDTAIIFPEYLHSYSTCDKHKIKNFNFKI